MKYDRRSTLRLLCYSADRAGRDRKADGDSRANQQRMLLRAELGCFIDSDDLVQSASR